MHSLVAGQFRGVGLRGVEAIDRLMVHNIDSERNLPL
jgi:hypothetical protein